MQPDLFSDEVWIERRDGDPTGRAIYRRHYTYRASPHRDPALFVGPGRKMVLITPCARALFVWRMERHRLDAQVGVNCAVFRNEGAGLSSALILAAEIHAARAWPGSRMFTFVDSKRITSRNPGYCFKMAGWKACGFTKDRHLTILEKYPRADPA